MSKLSENIRYLRGELNLSQQALADSLKLTRGRYAKYEDGANEPPIDVLISMSKYFKISLDLLLTVDLAKYPIDRILTLADNRIILPITVDGKGENKIEIIPQKASMGYLNGYSDPEYIENLQSLSLPFLRNGKYRAFPTEGDSMPPYNDGTYVVGKYVENIADLKKGKTYIFITRNEGITYKRFQKNSTESISVTPDNDFYEPYDIPKSQVLEIWEYACSINTEELGGSGMDMNSIKDMFISLKKEINELKRMNGLEKPKV